MKSPAWLTAALVGLVGCGHAASQTVTPVVATEPPVAVAASEAPVASPAGPVPGAERVIAKLRPRFKVCYERGRRDENPRMAGHVLMTATVAPDGTVRNAKIEDKDGLSARVVACIADQMKKTAFPPPGGDGGAVQVPVTFVRAPQ